jgi:hypothetical protein
VAFAAERLVDGRNRLVLLGIFRVGIQFVMADREEFWGQYIKLPRISFTS